MTAKVQNDIESNNFTELKSILVKPDETKNSLVVERIIRFVCFLFMFIFVFPMIFCDYYFAINNDVCMNQPLYVSLTMYDYLIVNAVSASVIVLVLLLLFMFCENETVFVLKENIAFLTFTNMVRSFVVSWIIVGAVMYWGEMDRSLCSKSANDYLTATLILRMVMTSFEICNNFNKKR
jgi:hypothetical protein